MYIHARSACIYMTPTREASCIYKRIQKGDNIFFHKRVNKMGKRNAEETKGGKAKKAKASAKEAKKTKETVVSDSLQNRYPKDFVCPAAVPPKFRVASSNDNVVALFPAKDDEDIYKKLPKSVIQTAALRESEAMVLYQYSKDKKGEAFEWFQLDCICFGAFYGPCTAKGTLQGSLTFKTRMVFVNSSQEWMVKTLHLTDSNLKLEPYVVCLKCFRASLFRGLM
jgi:hypothetical protein